LGVQSTQSGPGAQTRMGEKGSEGENDLQIRPGQSSMVDKIMAGNGLERQWWLDRGDSEKSRAGDALKQKKKVIKESTKLTKRKRGNIARKEVESIPRKPKLKSTWNWVA